jgi:hypothetical protein
MDPIALTPKQLAKITPLGEHRIRQLCQTDPTFPAFLNGRNIVIPLKPLEEWLAKQADLRVGYPEIMKRGKKERR